LRNPRLQPPFAGRAAALAALWAERDFFRVWLAGGLVGVLRWFEILAVSVFTFQLTGSPSAVALMTFIRMAPLFLFGLLAGALADRFDRKRLLILGLLVLTVSSLMIAALAWSGRIELWHIAAGSFLNGIFWSAEFPVRRTMLGEIAGMDRLNQAMALEAATGNATRMLGPPLGGLLLEVGGLGGAFLLATVVYAIGIVVVLPVAHRSEGGAGRGWSMLGTLIEGWRFIRARRLIVGTLAVTVAVNLWGFAYITMVPVIGELELGLSAFLIGILMAGEGLGALIGAFLVGIWGRPHDYARIYLGSSVLFQLAVLAFALSGWVPLSFALILLCGLAIAGFAVMQSTILFLAAPAEVRSRVMGVLTVSIGAGPIGMLHVGWLADWLGPSTAVAVMAIEGLIAVIAAAIIWPELRRPGDPAPPRGRAA
jgi:MFS family permease